VIVLHGGGANGRLVGALGTIVAQMGYEYVAPDLPGFGLTTVADDYDPAYDSWVTLVSQLIEREIARDGKPITLFGGSLGGILAYNAACLATRGHGISRVVGVIATTLADPRYAPARDALARNKVWSRAGSAMMRIAPRLLDRITVQARTISRLELITNDPLFSELFVNDPLVGKSRISLRFYRTMTEFRPVVPPEEFRLCPVLLVHPADDRWTPYKVSQPFFDRIAGNKRLVLLPGCGHLPYEQPGLSVMAEAIEDFMQEIEQNV
jgi:alpha-beta hydrolase superfamily lysophospholipase